jgi:hypothetical protein
VRYLFDSLPECRQRNPWNPHLPDAFLAKGSFSWDDDIPREWRNHEDGVIHSALGGTNSVAIFEVFLEYGMSADQYMERVECPLASAVSSGNVGLARLLLENGANPNGRAYMSRSTFLGRAANATKTDMLELLLERGALIQNSHALLEATKARRICNAQILLDHGADINEIFTREVYRSLVRREETLGSALHFAIKGTKFDGSSEEKLMVLERIPVTDSPTDMVRFLLQRGARLDLRDGNGKTPLEVAQEAGEKEIAEILMQEGSEKSM